jgi:hypothetical protein
MKHKLIPMPCITLPTNKPATLLVDQLLTKPAMPSRLTPSSAVRRAPSHLTTRPLTTARAARRDGDNEPTKESVASDDDRPDVPSAACSTPQLYDVPTNHHATTAQPASTVHAALPPSGTVASARCEACRTGSTSESDG